MNILETEWWSLAIPPEWWAESEEDSVLVGDRDDVGVIEISTLHKENGEFSSQEVATIAAEEGEGFNGLPVGVIELKNAADEDATIWSAFNQLQTYKQQIPGLFHFNEVLVASDGLHARIGSLTAIREWFKPWRNV